MVSKFSLDCKLPFCPNNPGDRNGVSNISPPSQDPAIPQIPAKKQTRQWAAWTHQEEERFFAALRQVGKNFEKITCRVQSKNKEQVRHYYYRLVRRMNKLLGPEFCLNAKNSKDTNAAMLRWWSLLESYSCKPSKLHLKPRRFKIFVETLESQLLKDRKKKIRKRSAGENISSIVQVPASNQGRASGTGNCLAKMVLVDGQNVQKVGAGKESLLKRQGDMATNRSNCKAEPASGKIAKHRRKTGLAATAAYKRWEKAAIAGVSLVAAAAEHLERVDTDKEIEPVQERPGQVDSEHVQKVGSPSPEVSESVTPVQKVSQSIFPAPEVSQCMCKDANIHNHQKLKLQLFPIDDCTRRMLETVNRNPHLELTVSTRKKISSVVEHLNQKWGNSNLSSQELILFPYWAQRENLVGYQRWTKDSPLCAADVYNSIGSPPFFRLRYGWFSKAEIESATAQMPSCANAKPQISNIDIAKERNTEIGNQSALLNDQFFSAEQMATVSSSLRCPINAVDCSGSVCNLNASTYHDDGEVVFSNRREACASAVSRLVENTNQVALSAGDWADSLTNINVGDLLTDTQHMDVNNADFRMPDGSTFFQQIPLSCDSFDAAIAAHIYKHQNTVDSQQSLVSHGPSMWDADETCDAFAFQEIGALSAQCWSASRNDPGDTCELTAPNPSSHKGVEELTEDKNLTIINPPCENLMDGQYTSICSPENSTKDFNSLADIYWPDSLGPLDLDILSCRHQSHDLILNDSLGSLNRLIANSLDAFQNFSLFGFDKKESTSTTEPRQTISFADFKISGEV